MYFRDDRGEYPETTQIIDGTEFKYKRDPRWGHYFVQFTSGKTPAVLTGKYTDINLLKEKVEHYFENRPAPDRQHTEFRNGLAKEKREAKLAAQRSNSSL